MKIFIIATFIALIAAQGPGNGISKSTWGASDPQKCMKFNDKYLNTKVSADSCKNGICDCGTQGRVQVKDSIIGNPMSFGIHAINCTHHPYGEKSLKDIEEEFQENFNHFQKYHPFMDFNAGFWLDKKYTNELIANFQKDGVEFLPLKWTSDDGKDYYSLLFSPCGFMVLEVITDSVDDESIFQKSDSRFSFKSRNNKPTYHLWPTKYLTPLKISRGTVSLDKVKNFYNKNIGAKMIKTQTFDDSSEVATFMYDSIKTGVQLQYWQGRINPIQNRTQPQFTIQELEEFLMKTHRKYMVTPTCGFSQWMDNHYAVDFRPDQKGAVTLDAFAKHFKEQGLPYHWWSLPNGMTQVYGVDPTGWGIQIDSTGSDTAPSKLPSYSAACKSDDGCAGQGLCNSAQTVSSFLNSLRW